MIFHSFRVPAFVAMCLMATQSLLAGIEAQPMHIQMDVTKKCVKILKKVKDKRTADAAAAKLETLLKPYDKVVTAMGEQGDPEPDPAAPKRERKVPKNVIEKQKLDLGYELKRIEDNESCQSDKLNAVKAKLPPSTQPPTQQGS